MSRPISCLLLVHLTLFAAAPPARPTPDQAKALARRKPLGEQAVRALKAGKRAEAIRAAEAVLAIERRVLGPWHRDTESTASFLADAHQGHGEWLKEADYRRAVAEARRRLDGEQHWKTVNARMELAEAQARRTPAQRDALKQAEEMSLRGLSLSGEGRHADALSALKQSLATRKGILGERHHHYATSLNNLALVYARMGDHKASLPLYEQALAVYGQQLGDRHPLYANCLSNLAALHKDRGDSKAALPPARRALALRKEAWGGRHPDYAASLTQVALLLNDRGDPKAALPMLEEASAICKEAVGERTAAYATSLNHLGLVRHALGHHSQALKLYKRALALRKEVLGERHPDYATSLSNLALMHQERGDHKAALPLYRQAAAIYKKRLGERHPLYAGCLNNLAMLHHAMGNHQQALDLYNRALVLWKELLGERHPDYATALNNLALLHQEMGDYRAALSLYRRAMAVRKEALGERHSDYAQSLNNLALLHQAMGDYKAALPLFRQASALYKETLGPRHPAYATSLSNLALLHQQMGDHRSALPLHQQVLALRKEILGERHPDYATSLNNLALLHAEAGEHKEALPLARRASALYKEALGERHPGYATSLNNLAHLYQQMGDLKSAVALSQRALALRKEMLGERHPDYATSLNNLALMHQEARDYESAVPLFTKASALFKEVLGERHPHHARCLNNLALLRLELGDHKAAVSLSEQALTVGAGVLSDAASVQSDRQQFVAAQAFRTLLDVRLSLPGRPGNPPSYRHVLAWKGALLMRQQQRRLFLRIEANPAARAAAERLQSATRRLAALTLTPAATRDRLQELEKQQEEAQAELSRLSKDFRAARDQERPSTAAVIAALPEGAVLIDFLFYVRHGLRGKDGKPAPRRELLAYVLRRGKPIVRVGLGPAATIEEVVAQWREALLGQRAEERERAERVHALIWAPLREELEGAKVVLVSPDGVLGGVPFAALPGREKGTFLIEDVTLAAVPLPRSLPEMSRAADAGGSLLVAGDLRYQREGDAPRPGGLTLPRLEATKAEVVSVAASFRKRYPGGTVTDLREGDATKPAVRKALQSVRFAHLATHGYFAPEGLMVADGARSRREALGWHPLLLSGLALSDSGRGEGGILTALEVSEMDLTRLDLAVLSACETGLGRAAGGEGLLGLQRAFQGAGARSVAASLWKVDDEYTQKLMTHFYAAAWDAKKPVSRAEALRQAQLSLLREWDRGGPPRRLAPFFWAAFVLSGDWR